MPEGMWAGTSDFVRKIRAVSFVFIPKHEIVLKMLEIHRTWYTDQMVLFLLILWIFIESYSLF